jgi:hypothetical protein
VNSRLSDIRRSLRIDLAGHNAALLLGPRKVGKTTLLRQQFPEARYDLLDSDLRTRLLLRRRAPRSTAVMRVGCVRSQRINACAARWS